MFLDSAWLVIIITLALAFGFLNGFNDSGSIVSMMISSGALSPRSALFLASLAEFVGPFVFGVAIAAAIGKGIVDLESITTGVILAALVGAIMWNIVSLRFSVPSSSTHALVGGLVGAALAAQGVEGIEWEGLSRIVAALFLAPVIGGLLGYVSLKTIIFLARGASPSVNRLFKRSQVATALALALLHGTIDGQKTMGIITMSLVALGILPGFYVPMWVVAASAGFLALGIAGGGSSITRTLGTRMYKIRPVHGFAVQAASSVAVLGAVALGGPVSATHVLGSAIVGVGTAERRSRVRWDVVGTIAMAWLLTLPTAAVAAALVYLAMGFVT